MPPHPHVVISRGVIIESMGMAVVEDWVHTSALSNYATRWQLKIGGIGRITKGIILVMGVAAIMLRWGVGFGLIPVGIVLLQSDLGFCSISFWFLFGRGSVVGTELGYVRGRYEAWFFIRER